MNISRQVKIVVILVAATLVLAIYLYRRSEDKRVVSASSEPRFTEKAFATLKVGDVLVDIKGREWVVKEPLHTVDLSIYGEGQRLERYIALSPGLASTTTASLKELLSMTKEIRRKP